MPKRLSRHCAQCNNSPTVRPTTHNDSMELAPLGKIVIRKLVTVLRHALCYLMSTFLGFSAFSLCSSQFHLQICTRLLLRLSCDAAAGPMEAVSEAVMEAVRLGLLLLLLLLYSLLLLLFWFSTIPPPRSRLWLPSAPSGSTMRPSSAVPSGAFFGFPMLCPSLS